MKKPKVLNTVFDFLWALQAYLRGKVLCQKDYRPQGDFFRLSTRTNYRRITLLMSWWGRRLATVKEAIVLMAESKMDDDSSHIFKNPELPFWFGPAHMHPYLHWNNGAWRLRYECDWFDFNGLTVPIRKF